MKSFFTSVMSIAALFSTAFAFQYAWLWFLVPLSVPPITYWHALGLTYSIFVFFIVPVIVTAALCAWCQKCVDTEKLGVISLALSLTNLIIAWVGLTIMWVIHRMMIG